MPWNRRSPGSQSFDLRDHVLPYERVDYVCREYGYVVWRMGTGQNVELLHLKVYPDQRRKGYGRGLLQDMLIHLENLGPAPRATIYGFCLPDNIDGQEFYKAMGFTLEKVLGVYEAGQAILFSANYDELVEKHLASDDLDSKKENR